MQSLKVLLTTFEKVLFLELYLLFITLDKGVLLSSLFSESNTPNVHSYRVSFSYEAFICLVDSRESLFLQV